MLFSPLWFVSVSLPDLRSTIPKQNRIRIVYAILTYPAADEMIDTEGCQKYHDHFANNQIRFRLKHF